MKLKLKLTNILPAVCVAASFVIPFAASAADPAILKMVFVPASEKGDDSDYESLIKIISDRAGIQIQAIKVTDYNAAVEAMRANRAQIAWYGGKTYIKAAEIANAEAFAAGVRKGESNAGYYSYFVVRSDSPLSSLKDVKHTTLGLNSIGSTSGDLIPRVELFKAGLSVANKGDFKRVVYAGSHDACLLAVINKHVDVCGMSSRNFAARLKDGTFSANQVRIIHKSNLVPPPPLAYSKNLSQGLRDEIKIATLEAHKFGKIGGYGGEMSHYVEVVDSDYDALRDVEKLLK
jgi:phosphonate transport system substrate-binding protein